MNKRSSGFWILAYDLLGIGVLGFLVNFGIALSVGDSGILYSLTPAQNIFFTITSFMMSAGWLFGFVLLFIGGIGVIFDKRWARGVSRIGVESAFLMCAGIALSAFLIFDLSAKASIIFFLAIALVLAASGLFIFRSAAPSRK